MELTSVTTVRRPVPEVYEFWRRLENLPMIMTHLEEVRPTGERTSHWTSSAIAGRTLEWDAEITEEVPGRRLRWRSVGEPDLRSTGSVVVVPAPDGLSSEVHMRLTYDLRDGEVGRAVSKYFGDDPHEPLDEALRRMKQVLEVGEVVRSDGAPWGKRSRAEFPQHPARPLSTEELAKGAPV